MHRPISRGKKPAQPEPPPRQPEPAESVEDLAALFADVKNPKQASFLAAYLQTKRLIDAQRLSRVHRHSHYLWLESDPDYPAYFRRAKAIIADEVEEDAYRRAFVGVEHPIYYHGRVIDYYKVYSEKLAIFMLKALKPEIYGNKVDIDFPDRPTDFRITMRREGEEGLWGLGPGPETWTRIPDPDAKPNPPETGSGGSPAKTA
jgi:hypothetical protein